jgi:hypothetical protein
MIKKVNGKVKQAFNLILPLNIASEFTWSGRAKINDIEISKENFSDLIGIISLIQVLVEEAKKDVEVAAKEYIRRVKDELKKGK